MMLNMSTNFEGFHSRSEEGFAVAEALFDEQNRHNKESIHSGHFMVSQFEAEEAQDDDDDDSEIKMPDPDDPSLIKADDTNPCMEVQLYVPRKVMEFGTPSIATSHLEIETSLTKLFKCMNLAYSQKLTSPKWNHFKGVRLRWKDKIRLNNVIWRCWHMQFIMKKRTPVCQFASPLDVDVHSNPQSVVLEGKYWKRQLTVIKAEYRKWRRNFKSKATGCLIYDTKSEFDFLEWSPLENDRSLMLTDDWTTDTLFSTINVPFPFPDPREIARGAGIADFIQPSLGPLQPNLEDIDLTFQELLGNRLPPVPEEGNDDILKGVEFSSFPAIMGSEQMDSSVLGLTSNRQSQSSQSRMDDTNMIELNLLKYPDLQTPLGVDESSNIGLLSSPDFSDPLLSNTSPSMLHQAKQSSINTFPINSDVTQNQTGGFPGKSVMKGRVSKSVQRPFKRREPHNYDKAQPTMHQTSLYQQMLAEQQQQAQSGHIQHQLVPATLQSYPQQYSNNHMSNTNNYNMQQANMYNLPTPLIKSYSVPQILPMSAQKVDIAQNDMLSLFNINAPDQYKPMMGHHQSGPSSTGPSYKPYPSPHTQQILKKSPQSSNYINLRPGQSISYLAADQQQCMSPQQQPQSLIPMQHAPALSPKEMFRSNSLPLNTTLPKLEIKSDTFAVPKYQAKSHKSRSRSNSIQQSSSSTNLQVRPQLQSATSDPMLNSTLAQLLTTNPTRLSNKQSSSTSAISTAVPQCLPPTGFNVTGYTSAQNVLQVQVSTQPQPTPQKPISPKKASSLPLPPSPMMLHSPPGNKMMSFPPMAHPTPMSKLSPDSFPDPDSPLSPSMKYPRENQRRVGHIHAEQKRRYNIKNGFDMLLSLIPQLQQNPNAKFSKAAMLQKGAEYIKQLRSERTLLNDKMDALRKERDALNNSLSHLHSILPANGAPVSRQRTEHVKQLYEEYVRRRTMQNWKYWILGLILEPLLNSYTTTVSIASIEELRRTGLLWVDQHCSLIDLRPAVSNKLRYLSMTTDVLSESPSTLQEEVSKAINNPSGQHPNLNGP